MVIFNMVSVKRLLIVGLGSIGTTHFSKASNQFNEISVVDTNTQKSIEVMKLGKSHNLETRFYHSIEELPLDAVFDLVVLANWGPDHAMTYRKVSMRSECFLIEKPLASSIDDLVYLRGEALKGKTIVTNLQWNYSGFKERIIGLSAEYKLGNLSGIQLFGGAKCLVTNGIHYLSLASQLFESYPERVTSILGSENINPRRDDFLYFDGVSVWQYGENRYFSTHLQNQSHVSETFRIIFEYGIIEINKGKMVALSIQNEDRKILSKRSRTLLPSQRSESIDAFIFANGKDGMDEIYRKFMERSFVLEDFDAGYEATLGIIASLLSSKDGGIIDLVEREWMEKKEARVDWNIT